MLGQTQYGILDRISEATEENADETRGGTINNMDLLQYLRLLILKYLFLAIIVQMEHHIRNSRRTIEQFFSPFCVRTLDATNSSTFLDFSTFQPVTSF
jgi:hypothetical protein